MTRVSTLSGVGRVLGAVVVVLGLAAMPPSASAATIVIGPGSSPAGGYLPLSLFGLPAIAGMTDETLTNVAVPSFDFAGQAWTQLGISSNGYVVVGGGTGADQTAVNQSLPNPLAPNNVLAPFWTDLDPGAGGALRFGTLTDGTDAWVVVDWQAVPNKSNATQHSFQIWLGVSADGNPGEDISFVYGPVGPANAGLLTIGAEDATGTVGAMYHFNGTGPTVTDGTQLRVTTRDFPLVPEPGLLLLTVTGIGSAIARRVRRSKK